MTTTMRDTSPRTNRPGLQHVRESINDTARVDTTGARINPADNHPDRRVDRWYATYHVPAEAVTGFRVAALEEIELGTDSWLTDHRPIEVTLDEHALTA